MSVELVEGWHNATMERVNVRFLNFDTEEQMLDHVMNRARTEGVQVPDRCAPRVLEELAKETTLYVKDRCGGRVWFQGNEGDAEEYVCRGPGGVRATFSHAAPHRARLNLGSLA